MDALWNTLQARRRPEDVAELIRAQLSDKLAPRESAILKRAARGALKNMVLGYTSMLEEFAAPAGMAPQVQRARVLFASASRVSEIDSGSPAQIEAFVRAISPEIGKAYGASDFLHDRLNGAMRDTAGVRDSRRKYNRKFRLLRRMERKLVKLGRELQKWDLTRVGKSGLATRIPREAFFASESAACFVAYLTARANLRSEFTVWGQQRAFDEIAAMLFARCERDARTNWFAVAHVYPHQSVLARLTDGEKGTLLATWLGLLNEIATLLEETWQRSRFDLKSMIVRRGDDSTTWNSLASAWNKARDGWVALLYAMGLEPLLEQMCFGKVMRLMAADVAYWHRAVGHGLDPNTAVWAALPHPWEVLAGRVTSTRAQVEAACRACGVDPEKTGWIAPRPAGAVMPFRPTPELVHGVTVANPLLAAAMRKAGWFSGKPEAVKPLTVATAPSVPERESN